jgi:hypothetical protein
MDIFTTLMDAGLTTGKREFSVHWAGKSPSYFATTGTLSEGAMVAVFRRLLHERRWMLAIRVAHTILIARNSLTQVPR